MIFFLLASLALLLITFYTVLMICFEWISLIMKLIQEKSIIFVGGFLSFKSCVIFHEEVITLLVGLLAVNLHLELVLDGLIFQYQLRGIIAVIPLRK